MVSKTRSPGRQIEPYFPEDGDPGIRPLGMHAGKPPFGGLRSTEHVWEALSTRNWSILRVVSALKGAFNERR